MTNVNMFLTILLRKYNTLLYGTYRVGVILCQCGRVKGVLGDGNHHPGSLLPILGCHQNLEYCLNKKHDYIIKTKQTSKLLQIEKTFRGELFNLRTFLKISLRKSENYM